MKDPMPARFQRLFDALCYGQLVEDHGVSKARFLAKGELADYGVQSWFAGIGFNHGCCAENAPTTFNPVDKTQQTFKVEEGPVVGQAVPPPSHSEPAAPPCEPATEISDAASKKESDGSTVEPVDDSQLEGCSEEDEEEEEETMVEIDALTSVPLQLFTDMLMRAKRAKLRGQHTLRAVRSDNQMATPASRRRRLHLVLTTASP